MEVHFSVSQRIKASPRLRKFAAAATALLLTCLLAMGYHLLHPSSPASAASRADLDELRRQLCDGDDGEQRQALRRLVTLNAQGELTRCLASDQPVAVQLASAGLWECWLNEAGPSARHRLEEGVDLMNSGNLDAAALAFKALADEFPTWAEAPNKLATVLYLQGNFDGSIELCHQVVARKPDHFGAWNGMAICAIQRENWPLAMYAVRESLRLQPHSRYNQQLFRLVQSRLPEKV